jgi:hypothetical protein
VKRRLGSWIESFVDQTANLHNPAIFRKWTGIATIAAVLEQKVWLRTSRPMYPNLYVMLVGHPGVGKTRAIREGRHYVKELPEFHLAPISMTFASLVDSLVKSKRVLIRPGEDPLEYNSMFICVDELGAFIHKYDNEMIDGLSAFYDPDPYQQVRRTSDIHIKINAPQINILCGSTPQNLTDLMPEKAWGQGFTSRLLMIFSDERIIGDDFAPSAETFSEDLAHDLSIINSLVGQFEVTEAYRSAVNNWRELGELPVPNHPKLIHYVTRRRAHLYKLSMVAAIDRSNALILTREDFNIAMGWLLEAESTMIEIFKAGATNADAQAMDEILHFIKINDRGHGISEQKITRFASERIPLHSILRVIDIMESSGQIFLRGVDRSTKLRYFSVIPEETSK